MHEDVQSSSPQTNQPYFELLRTCYTLKCFYPTSVRIKANGGNNLIFIANSTKLGYHLYEFFCLIAQHIKVELDSSISWNIELARQIKRPNPNPKPMFIDKVGAAFFLI